MPQLVEPANLPPAPFNGSDGVFYNTTLRQTVQVGLEANKIRLGFSNAFGVNNLNITSAAVSRAFESQAGISTLQSGSTQKLQFSGKPSISIPNGGLVVTDPIEFPVQAQSVLMIDLFLEHGQDGFAITGHPGSRTTSFMSIDDQVGEKNLTSNSVQSTEHWYFISAVEGLLNEKSSSFAIVGDSITDGRGSTTNANNRWPDLLQKKLNQGKATAKIAILNQAAGGNRILHDGLGPNAVSRIDRDVLAQPGIKYAMIFEGVNDIGVAGPDIDSQAEIGDQLIMAFQQIARRVQAAGILFGGATITPFGSPASSNYTQPYSDSEREKTRQRINYFIRNSGIFDFVLDLDRVVHDPQNKSVLLGKFDSGDHLHPNEAGYQAIADYFPSDFLL
ncbi:hypothetical protein N7481_001245 [Penicillium waksmanii]|uniref:uncharacterized protein n=1 Tax=Penicillium waksmanii TaxID=69791 RepID=UPI0025481634|nr:uncharacterized protein N7481_001245 [Penicillium waksmanii]KAJ6000836.1 hypothetical protein N7481_001245 [Penicillium waksmanii]